MSFGSDSFLKADRIQTFLSRLPTTEPAALTLDPGLDGHSIVLPSGDTAYLQAPGLPAQQLPILLAALHGMIAYEHEVLDLTRELSTLYEEITLLYRLSQAFSGQLHLEQIQQTALNEIADTLGVGKISVLMLNEERDALILTGGLGITAENIGKMRFAKDCGLAWRVVREGLPLIVNDLSGEPDYLPGPAMERALLLVPLTTKTGLAGVLSVSDKEDGHDFTSKDEKLLSAIAQQMGSVWENARLYREARELFLNTVSALSAAIDAKDPYTHGHSGRVTEFSVRIAEELQLPMDDVENIRIAAMLHDVGKLGVAEGILRKPDRLTSDEFAEIKKHPVIGAEIMGHVKKLACFIPGMVDHHERFDGSGYPEGRIGTAISLAGRIIAVADTFDAMTSNRPYHPECKGKPDHVALAEIERCSGSHFDPEVAAAFLRAYQKGLIHQDRSLQAES